MRKRYPFYWTYVLNRLLNGLGPFTRQNTEQSSKWASPYTYSYSAPLRFTRQYFIEQTGPHYSSRLASEWVIYKLWFRINHFCMQTIRTPIPSQMATLVHIAAYLSICFTRSGPRPRIFQPGPWTYRTLKKSLRIPDFFGDIFEFLDFL